MEYKIMKKSILSILLSIVVIFSMLPASMAAERVQYRDENGNIKYCTDYEIIDDKHTNFNASKDMWLVFDGKDVKLPRISFNGSRIINLIIKDDQKITVVGGINLRYGTLVIYGQENGTGELKVLGSGNFAGIGGNSFDSIVINGGKITASSERGAGIGSAYGNVISECEDIIINGGNIKASSESGAGIGAGQGDRFYTSCGNITIVNGTVDAESVDGAAIGTGCAGGSDSACGNIHIKSGTVNAKATGYGAAIGTGFAGSANTICGNITIDGGKVTASAKDGAGIGLGWSYRDTRTGNITINGGNVTASSVYGEGIGKASFNSDGKIGKKTSATGVSIKSGDSAETASSVKTLKDANGKYVKVWGFQDAGGIPNIKPEGTIITKLLRGEKSFTVKWKKKSEGITGYQIQYATNKKFTKGKKTVTVKGYNKSKKTFKKLKSNKKYYVRIRTYKSINSVITNSDWSKTKSTRTKISR